VYTRHGYRDAFMAWGRYIGHFIGISVHDVGGIGGPAAARPLPAGVVFNVEPILHFDDRKIHIRLEDTVLLTETGAENLTAGVPAELNQVYALVKERGVNSTGMAAAAR
jgi:Xaa-Pro aminopeptidase